MPQSVPCCLTSLTNLEEMLLCYSFDVKYRKEALNSFLKQSPVIAE